MEPFRNLSWKAELGTLTLTLTLTLTSIRMLCNIGLYSRSYQLQTFKTLTVTHNG